MTNGYSIAFITDADRRRELMIKEHLDAIAYPLRFFREYDEPNEVFAPRLVHAFPSLAPAVALLHFWPHGWCYGECCHPRQERGAV